MMGFLLSCELLIYYLPICNPSPIITPGPPGSWDDELVVDGHVIFVQDTLKMWYLGMNQNHAQYPYKGIGLAYSADSGETWHKYPNNPVFVSDSSSPWEHTSAHTDGLWEAEVIYDNNEYKMWYQCWDAYNCYNTLYASSPDGKNWSRHNNGRPVLYAGYYEGGDTQWDSHYAGVRSVIKLGSLFYLFYEAEGFYHLGSMMMGLAIGVNETTFAKVDTLNPVFTTLGTPDTLWAGGSIIPNVILDDNTWSGHHHFILIYSSNSAHTGKATVGLARSTDGIHWERYEFNPICDLNQMGIQGGALTSICWDLRNGLVKDLLGIVRSIPLGIYSCKLSFLLQKP